MPQPSENIDNEMEYSPKQRQYLAKRTFIARSDASVSAIKNSIEKVFGLPEGSIAIRTPDGKSFRSDALISTVRERWGYND